MARSAFVVAAALVAAPAAAHHGIGTFNTREEITITGVVTGVDFVNPHSWLYLDVTGADGKIARGAARCARRRRCAARAGRPRCSSKASPSTITGAPDRNDPNSCYLSTIVFADGSSADRYGQLSTAPAPRAAVERAARLPSGEPNLSGDWAPEQLVMTDPRGRGGALVPLSQAQTFEPGANTAENARQYRTRDVELTPAGREKADAFETYNPQHNPRMRCETTSIIFRLDLRRRRQSHHANGGHGHARVRPARLHAHDSPEPDRASGDDRALARRSLDRPLGERRARRRHRRLRARRVVAAGSAHGSAARRRALFARSRRAHARAQLHGRGSRLLHRHVQRQRHARGRRRPVLAGRVQAELTFIDYSKEGQSPPPETPAPAKPWWKFWD